MKSLAALLAGLLFGIGLLVSGMTNPANVLAFLDVTGSWSPALAFTMAGAVLVAGPAFHYVRRQRRTLTGANPELPANRRVDSALVSGSVIFGIGWGLSGICPGPGLILLVGGGVQAVAFVASLVAGSVLSRLVAPRRSRILL